MVEPSQVIIAIDGPAGAGKSTVAKAVAQQLHLRYLDTGAMYRALSLKAVRLGLGAEDGDAVAKLGDDTTIGFGTGNPQPVFLDGEDVTKEIRTAEIGQLASQLSTHSGVRRVLVEQQRAILTKGGVTLEGRDVTTVVAPHAHVKVYLTASLEERARRRLAEFEEKGQLSEFAKVRQEIEQRDHRDITRDDSPLAVADGATIIDSAHMTPDEVVEAIKRLVSAAIGA